jgi:PAS domain S-box-containing protein
MNRPRVKVLRSSRRAGAPSRRLLREEQLLAKVKAAEESLRAIPSRDVDALVVLGRNGARVVTLKGGESAYRLLVEAMSEGAATVSSDGVLLYCNRRFAGLVGRPAAKLIGLDIQSLLHQPQRERLETLLRSARKHVAKGEFLLRASRGKFVPVYLSVSPLEGYRGHALGMVVTDLTEQRRKQADEMKTAKAFHRLLLERELAAQEGERRRMARELHDEAGQLLTSLLVGLRSLEDSSDVDACKTLGKRMREITTQAIDEIGRLARGLHPTALDDHGLDAALTRYIAEYSTTHGIPVELKVDGLNCRKLPAAVQVALYRILQETLTNIARHSGAKNARVAFRHSARRLQVFVTDDGTGFDASAMAGPAFDHLGLQSIRERSAMLGGTASFASGSKGTEVLVEIPLKGWQFPSVRSTGF